MWPARTHSKRTFEQRNAIGMEAKRNVGGECDFAGVSDQAEAGDVGHGVDGKSVVGRWSLVAGCGASLRRDRVPHGL